MSGHWLCSAKLTHLLVIICDLLFLLVCIKFLTNFASKLTSKEMSDPGTIQQKLKDACAKAKKKENRFVSKFGLRTSRLAHCTVCDGGSGGTNPQLGRKSTSIVISSLKV